MRQEPVEATLHAAGPVVRGLEDLDGDFGVAPLGQGVAQRTGEAVGRDGDLPAIRGRLHDRQELRPDRGVPTADHRQASQAGAEHGLERAAVLSPGNPLRDDRQRPSVLLLGTVEIAVCLEHQAVSAQHADPLVVVRAEHPRRGIGERGEDRPGLLQLPAGRQDGAQLREGGEGLGKLGPVPPHPVLAARAGQRFRLVEVGFGFSVLQGDDELADRAQRELVVGPVPSALDLQVLAEEGQRLGVVPGELCPGIRGIDRLGMLAAEPGLALVESPARVPEDVAGRPSHGTGPDGAVPGEDDVFCGGAGLLQQGLGHRELLVGVLVEPQLEVDVADGRSDRTLHARIEGGRPGRGQGLGRPVQDLSHGDPDTRGIALRVGLPEQVIDQEVVDRPRPRTGRLRDLALAIDARPRLAQQERGDRQHDHRRLEQTRPDGDAGAVLLRPADQPRRDRGAIDRDRLVGRPPLDLVGQGPTRRVAVLGPRRHRLEADRLERRVDGRVELSGSGEVAAADLAEDLADIALEGGPARKEAVERRAQAVDVRPRPEVLELAGGLLGAHVGGGAHGAARQRLGATAGRAGHQGALAEFARGVGLSQGLGEPPVDDKGLAVLADDDVCGLDVAVQHAARVGVLDGVADVDEPPEQLAKLQRAAAGVAVQCCVGVEGLDGLLEAVALDEPHGVVRPPALVAPQAVHGYDAGVLQPAGDLGLDEEPGAADRVVGVGVEDLLECDLAVELDVERDEDGAEAAPGMGPQDPEPLALADIRAGAEGGRPVGVIPTDRA